MDTDTRPRSYNRMFQLRDWLRLEYPNIKEAVIERKMGVATGYFNTREKASTTRGNKEIRPQTMRKVINAWNANPPETPMLNMEWLRSGQGDMFSDATPIDHSKGIPFYDADFIKSENIEKIMHDEPKHYISIPMLNRNNTFAMTASGSSMYPSISNGDVIVMQTMPDIESIIFGEIYAIITLNGMRTIRRITRSDKPLMIRLIPDNKDKIYGDYQDVQKPEIRRLFRVLCAIRIL